MVDKYYAKWRSSTIESMGGKCASCESTERLEFDHVDEFSKEFAVSGGWGMADKGRLAKELAKCQLLCINCHKKKSVAYIRALRLKTGFTHGTSYGWMKKKCTCEACREAQVHFNESRRVGRRSPSGRGAYRARGLHGGSRYKQGCRCEECTTGHRLRAREYRNRANSKK